MYWYLIHTKPRQEQRAHLNLVQQGYSCYLPLIATEKLRRRALTVIQEPLFARYLFIRLDTSQSAKSWTPIRSTQGVSRLVTFGAEPARIDAELIEALQANADSQLQQPRRLFNQGDLVHIREGPFIGLQAIYQMTDGQDRATVLIDILSKTSRLTLSTASLCRAE